MRSHRLTGVVIFTNSLLLAALAFGVFLAPATTLLRAIFDPALVSGRGMPQAAWSLHAAVSPRFERWARQRVASGRATKLGIHEIAGTEWPAFSSVFYLLATEALDAEWQR